MAVLLKKEIVLPSEIDDGWPDRCEEPLVLSHNVILGKHVATSVYHFLNDLQSTIIESTEAGPIDEKGPSRSSHRLLGPLTNLRLASGYFPVGNSPGTPGRSFANRYNPSAMTVFNANDVSDQQLDWTILRDGGVALYWRPEVLEGDITWLRSNGYRIIEFDAGEWNSEGQMHEALMPRLSFPDYYGRNLDALNDCMWEDIEIPDEGGLVLVFRRYDHFARAMQIARVDTRSFAEIVLHVFARAVRYHMLFGRRLMIIVQSDNPRVRFENLAAVAADWNPREWLEKNRGL